MPCHPASPCPCMGHPDEWLAGEDRLRRARLTVSSQGALAWLGGQGVQHLTFEPPNGGKAIVLAAAASLADRQATFSPAGDLVVFV